jgi:hypothetical protein
VNPVAAKIATTPETSDYTSIKRRVDNVEAEGKTLELEAARGGSVPPRSRSGCGDSGKSVLELASLAVRP